MLKNTVKQIIIIVVLSVPGVAYAQTCKPESIPATAPTSQFTDHDNGTVTDTKTGLMWKKCAEGQTWDSNTNGCAGSDASYTWQNALKQAQTLNTNGGFASYTDWRVPNKNELLSIVEEQCYAPAINLAVFPNTLFSVYWSSSPVAYDGYGVWYVSIYDGYVSDGFGFGFNKNSSGGIRLVRGE